MTLYNTALSKIGNLCFYLNSILDSTFIAEDFTGAPAVG